MARYDYRCSECDHEFEVTKPMAEWDTEEVCPLCEAKAIKLISCPTVYAEGVIRYSMALGIDPTDPKQVELAQKKHPGAEFTKDGRMIIHSRSEKLRRMREAGFVEYE